MKKLTRFDEESMADSPVFELVHQHAGIIANTMPTRTMGQRIDAGLLLVEALAVEACTMLSAMVDATGNINTDPIKLIHRVIDVMIAWQEEHDKSSSN